MKHKQTRAKNISDWTPDDCMAHHFRIKDHQQSPALMAELKELYRFEYEGSSPWGISPFFNPLWKQYVGRAILDATIKMQKNGYIGIRSFPYRLGVRWYVRLTGQ